jgi:sugar phosphate isomerase/epimerase
MSNFGIFVWFAGSFDRQHLYQLIKQNLFSATAIDLGKDIDNRKTAADTCRLIRDCGLQVAYVHAPFANANLLWSHTESARSLIKAEYCATLSFCQKQNIPVAVMHVSTGREVPACNSAGLYLLYDILCYAEECGVAMALENTRYGHYLDFIFGKLQSPYLKFCYDSSHDFLWGEKPGALLGRWGHLLAATHLADNRGTFDDHLLPGDGKGSWNAVFENFPQALYNKEDIFLEVIPTRSEAADPEKYLSQAYAKATWVAENLK